MRRLLSDARIRLGACVLAMAMAAGLGILTQAKEPVTRAEGAPDDVARQEHAALAIGPGRLLGVFRPGNGLADIADSQGAAVAKGDDDVVPVL